MKIGWGPQFELNIPFIDRQHKKLISTIEDLATHLKEKKRDHQKCSDTLRELREYVKVHFSEEETMLKRIHFPNLEQHLAAHNFFHEKLNELESKLVNNEPFLGTVLLAFLESWLFNHISNDDRAYQIYIREKGIDIETL